MAQTKKGKESAFQARDSTFHKGSGEVPKKKNSSKAHSKKEYGATFGQNVQKSDAEPGAEPKTDFSKENNAFFTESGQEQSEEREKKQSSSEDYHRRDTYRQSQKKGTYQKKRVQKEYSSRERVKDATFTDDAGSVFKEDSTDEFSGSKKLEKKQKQAQKAGKKVEKAKAKLPKKREYTLQRVFDEETGRAKYVVVPFDTKKPFKQEAMHKSTMKRLQNESRNFVHGKVAESEKENSAVEGAHKTEQRAEELFAFVKRQYKGKEHRQRAKVAKLEKKQFQKEVNFQYQKFVEENPQMQKKALQKRIQKQRIKREYMKAKRKGNASKNAGQAVVQTKNAATAIAKKLQELASKNIGVFATVGVVAILLIMIMTSVSSCGAMFADTQSTVLAASYLSKPKEIDATDLQFTRLELDLQNEIDRIETDYPGYDEYSYNLGEIGHNPFTLIGYLSAIHTEFTATEVESEVQALFEEMYELTTEAVTETRTREVQSTDEAGNLLYDEAGEPVMEEEEYEVTVLKVVLTVTPLEDIVAGKMNAEQTELFSMYKETGGLLQEFDTPVKLYWYNYISSYYGYRKNPLTGEEQLHRGVDIAVPTGTNVYATYDGTVTQAAYDSHYGNYVVLELDGYTTKYAHMETVSVGTGQTVEKGTIIGTTGNTGSSTGSHLHIECLYNGEYYNPLFYFDVGTGTIYGEAIDRDPTDVIPPDSYDDASVQILMEEAARYLGYPYVWGGSTPDTSFDCSGFVCWVYTNSGIRELPRTNVRGIYSQCTPVSPSEAKAGDFIFFTGTYGIPGQPSHVGIYCGDGVMIHCGDPISYVTITSSYWQSHFYSFGRLN